MTPTASNSPGKPRGKGQKVLKTFIIIGGAAALLPLIAAAVWFMTEVILTGELPDFLGFLITLYTLPFRIIGELAGDISKGSCYDTGITEDGYFRVVTERMPVLHFRSDYDYVLIDEDGVFRLEESADGSAVLHDYIPVREGSAEIVHEKKDPDKAAEDNKWEYTVFHIYSDGEKVTSFVEEPLTMEEYESLTGKEASYREEVRRLEQRRLKEESRRLTDEKLRYIKAWHKHYGTPLNAPASEEDISAWESRNGAVLPEELKRFLLYTNGFDRDGLVIYPLEQLDPAKKEKFVPGEYYCIGTSHTREKRSDGYDEHDYLILADREGGIYRRETGLISFVEEYPLGEYSFTGYSR